MIFNGKILENTKSFAGNLHAYSLLTFLSFIVIVDRLQSACWNTCKYASSAYPCAKGRCIIFCSSPSKGGRGTAKVLHTLLTVLCIFFFTLCHPFILSRLSLTLFPSLFYLFFRIHRLFLAAPSFFLTSIPRISLSLSSYPSYPSYLHGKGSFGRFLLGVLVVSSILYFCQHLKRVSRVSIRSFWTVPNLRFGVMLSMI
mmetsp:Transcript_12484/g.34320  ORF Transcript_12484/g.34320 Transcript_12484/m.34320 type:complete len:199 (-) Transcript_12484:636-1232(-)